MPNDQPSSHGAGNESCSTNSIAAARSWRSSMPSPNAPSEVPRGDVDPAKVEAQHREVGQRGQAGRRFAQDVRVHEAAVRRQRVQAHQRGDRRVLERERQLPHQRESVDGVQFDVVAAGRQLDAAGDLVGGRLAHARIFQQCACQWRRAARSSASPMMPSARQATR